MKKKLIFDEVRKRKSISTLFLLILGIALYSCDKVTSPSLPELANNSHKYPLSKKTELMNEVKEFARTLAITMKDPKFREIIKTEINNSQYVENIIEASNILRNRIDIHYNDERTNITVLDFMSSKLDKRESQRFKEKYSQIEYGQIDIYFPIKEHLKKWNGNEDLLVVANDQILAKEKGFAIGYDLNGNERKISAKEIPSIPVLVVTLSEKGKNYIRTNTNKIDKYKNAASTMSINSEQPTTYYSFCIDEYWMNKDYDGWLDGDNDIYFKYRIHYSGDPEGLWYGWYSTPVNSIELQNWKGCGYQLVSSSSRNFIIQIEMWEQDTFNDDPVADGTWSVYWPNGTMYLGNYSELCQGAPYNISASRQWELWDGGGSDLDKVRVSWSY